jgi:hypothetical protein
MPTKTSVDKKVIIPSNKKQTEVKKPKQMNKKILKKGGQNIKWRVEFHKKGEKFDYSKYENYKKLKDTNEEDINKEACSMEEILKVGKTGVIFDDNVCLLVKEQNNKKYAYPYTLSGCVKWFTQQQQDTNPTTKETLPYNIINYIKLFAGPPISNLLDVDDIRKFDEDLLIFLNNLPWKINIINKMNKEQKQALLKPAIDHSVNIGVYLIYILLSDPKFDFNFKIEGQEDILTYAIKNNSLIDIVEELLKHPNFPKDLIKKQNTENIDDDIKELIETEKQSIGGKRTIAKKTTKKREIRK